MIPPITEPMGRSWPVRNTDITVFRGKAIVTQRIFDLLPEYSTTRPSGVYVGKMWKSNEWSWVNQQRVFTDKWYLCWYDIASDPKLCSVKTLPIDVANPKHVVREQRQ